jgi:branched-chain amino acid transport system substrate-binding protein
MRQPKPGSVCKVVHALCYSILPVLMTILLVACSPPLKVGIIAGLTGSQSELGVAGRNGAMFRFEEENARRGMNRFLLTIEDDQNDPGRVPDLVERLRRAGVMVAIGPFTSTMALAVTKEGDDLLFVSPTASAKRLAGLDDMVVRLMGSVEAAALNLAKVMKGRYSLTSVAAIWDSNNSIYAEDYLQAFASGWGGGTIWVEGENPPDWQQASMFSRAFDSTTNDGLLQASAFLTGSSADSVLIIASGANAASAIRILRRDKYEGLIMVAGWAVTSDLSAWGTETLEDVVFSQQYDPAFDGPRFVNFKKNFMDRFGTEPSFGAIFGYEAADLVIRAMEITSGGSASAIKTRLLSLEPFESLQGNLKLDRFGDPERDVFMFQFKSGIPVRLE